jgi:tetratricopeptide (TPR) repeat protein
MIRAVICLLLLLGASPTQADQNDPRLPALFQILLDTTNPMEASQATMLIWSIWIESGDDAVDQLVEDGQDAAASGDLDRAIAIFDEVVAKLPGFSEGWNRRATFLYLARQFERSAEDVERVLALEPRHFGALSGLGLIRMEQGDARAALEAFQRALAVNPHLPAARFHIDQLRRALDGKGG